jgi:DNA polymerase-3 subunit epsilon
MVADAPSPEDIIPIIQGVFNSADLVLGYNVSFDISFIEKWAINLKEGCTVCDVMKAFAEVYGERSYYYGNCKWQPLIVAADYYGYNFDVHDSLEDVRATLYVYRKMHEAPGD